MHNVRHVTAVTFALPVSLALGAGTASAAPAPVPCSAAGSGQYNCQFYVPATASAGRRTRRRRPTAAASATCTRARTGSPASRSAGGSSYGGYIEQRLGVDAHRRHAAVGLGQRGLRKRRRQRRQLRRRRAGMRGCCTAPAPGSVSAPPPPGAPPPPAEAPAPAPDPGPTANRCDDVREDQHATVGFKYTWETYTFDKSQVPAKPFNERHRTSNVGSMRLGRRHAGPASAGGSSSRSR